MNDPLLIATNIRKTYVSGTDRRLDILRGVSFSVHRGRIVSIVGASGAGKSTLLHIIGALDVPTEGEVMIEGMKLHAMDDRQVSAFRNRHIGFVFQFHHLLPEFTAVENVMMPALIGGMNPAGARVTADRLLEQVNLSDRADHKPSELSGGEQQRIAVARALANSPSIVLADEPSGNLDEENAERLHGLLYNLSRDLSQTFIIVTHNPELARLADITFRLHDGQLHAESSSTTAGMDGVYKKSS